MMKRLISAVVILLASSSVFSQDNYGIHEVLPEDLELLNRLEVPGPGQEYVRCKSNRCYIIVSGEVIGSGPDGVYLIWSINEENE